MTIGIISLIAVGQFVDYLFPEYQEIAKTLDNAIAPAVTTLGISFLKLGHRVVIYTQDTKAPSILELKGANLAIYVTPANNKLKSLLHPFCSTYLNIKN